MNYPNPLNEQDAAAQTAVCQSCQGTAQLINDCKECGLPMEDQEAANSAQHEFARRAKQKFFPYTP